VQLRQRREVQEVLRVTPPISKLMLAYLAGEATCEVRRWAANHVRGLESCEAWARDWIRDTCTLKNVDFRLLKISVARVGVEAVVQVELVDAVSALGGLA